jgi:glycosyltransferase involved in cell wall biosynthesis
VTATVAYTLEQCWHQVPGGTAVAALDTAAALCATGEVDLVGVAARHRHPPQEGFAPPITVAALRAPSSAALYAAWLWTGRPAVERATGDVAVTHATTIIPPPTRAPLVVTVHDLAFLRYPEQFSRWGMAVFRRSLDLVRHRARLVLCSSTATMDDCSGVGIEVGRLRLVPLGVRPAASATDPGAAADEVRRRFDLPERFALFVGTLEPRKNLTRLVEAIGLLDEPLTLAVAGPTGWGDVDLPVARADVRLLGRVDTATRDALYAAAAVCCYPSTWEGFGLPVLEAMAAGAPVVTSKGVATEETAGGAAVLVDPFDARDIARGISEALRDAPRLRAAGLARAGQCTWERTARLTLDAYREVARW